ncbi:hypothetical protein HK101_001208 [Irineochytrium annulatum]|nr:hypothetical protein HK101_001208 [Irineochytrium annulatum]
MNLIRLAIAQKAAAPAYAVAAFANKAQLNVTYNTSEDVPVEVQGPLKRGSTDGTTTMKGIYAVLRYLMRVDPQLTAHAGAKDAIRESQIDYWLDFCKDNLAHDAGARSLLGALSELNSHLMLRTYLVGYGVSMADLACWGALKGSVVFAQKVKTPNDVGVHVARWFQHLETFSYVADAIGKFEKVKAGGQPAKGATKDQGSYDIPLKDAAPGKVVTRFPPEPSGYLHIGHAKAALLNEYFARKYDGKMILRFDDTNPSKEKEEFQESIKEDLALLGIKPDVVSYTSNHFDKLYELAVKLIKKGLAFCDDTAQEQMRDERMKLVDSKRRNNSIEENLRLFEEMKKGSEEGLRNCLRAKINMQDKNGTMRDPVIYRTNLEPHHRTGKKWKIYPTYDFACPLVDSLEGVTHALRTIEYRDRNAQYDWFLKALDVREVHVWDFSRISFVYTLLSKRKLAWFVEKGIVTGWDDPRFATVRGIRRRGMTIEALREYMHMQGASQRNLELEWDKIWAVNKKVIDPIAPRHTAIVREKICSVKVTLVDKDFKPHVKDMPRHKKNPDLGNKRTLFSSELYLEFADAKDLEVGEEITLMDWGNAIVETITWSADKSFVAEIVFKLHLEGDFKKTKKKLTWLSRGLPDGKEDQAPVRLTLMDYDYLITKKHLDEDDNFADFVTPVTDFAVEAWGDANLRAYPKGEIIQLERKGYYIVDEPLSGPNGTMRLISIPDGKVSSVESKFAVGAAAEKAPETKAAPSASKAKAAKAGGAAPAVSMYNSKQIYGKMPVIDQSKVSKMYKVPAVYDQNLHLEIEPAAAAEKQPAAAAKGAPAADGKAPAKDAKKEKKEKGKDKEKAAAAKPAEEGSLISKLDIVVGKILEVSRHPDADSLYVEKIDCGEPEPRTVVSGLVKFMKEEEINGKMILVLKNLKPAPMRGIKSFAMVLCASNADHTKVEFLLPPPGSKPGDKVYFKGHEGTPDEQLNPKKKIFESVQPAFKTRDDLVAVWEDVPFQTDKGLVKVASLAGASIK